MIDGVADGHAGVDAAVVQQLVDERLKSHTRYVGATSLVLLTF